MSSYEECCICLDMGTTRTRAWLVADGQVKSKLAEDFGVRDRAIDAKFSTLEERLHCFLLRIAEDKKHHSQSHTPHFIAAAGMLGSPSGIANVPHVDAPAGIEELACHLQCVSLAEVSPLPMFVVPGIRTHEDAITAGDLMRGEESLCVGMLKRGRLKPGEAVLNLGSHWKWILTDYHGNIAKSRTSLTGELIHSIQAHTLLASGLPQHRPNELDSDWLERGAEQVRREGLTRTLFCIRLLEQAHEGTPEQRLAYLYGAVLEGECDAVRKSQFFDTNRRVAIVGPPALAAVWRGKLASLGWSTEILNEDEIEQSYLEGLLEIVRQSSLWKKRKACTV